MSDTPRTDSYAGYIDSGGWWQYSCDGEFVQLHAARQLERELNEIREENKNLNADMILHERMALSFMDERDKLVEALELIDDYLSNAEDVMHGAGSDQVTIARGIISKSLAATKGKNND